MKVKICGITRYEDAVLARMKAPMRLASISSRPAPAISIPALQVTLYAVSRLLP
ncbi:MAG: hypothetical protein P8Y80_09560 [Acidobacteriota bacterium]